MEQLTIDGKEFRGDIIPLKTSAVLLIQGSNGMLGHALAIVTGVASYDDMLAAKVVRMSAAAAALGVTVGMTGKDALMIMG